MNKAFQMQWVPAYSVGIPLLDEQHKHLLDLCFAAKQLIQGPQRQTQEQIHGILHELTTYVEKHFETEEAHLDAIGYESAGTHIEAHQSYRAALTRLLLDATVGTLDPGELINYLGKWWIGHILGEDMKYAQQPG